MSRTTRRERAGLIAGTSDRVPGQLEMTIADDGRQCDRAAQQRGWPCGDTAPARRVPGPQSRRRRPLDDTPASSASSGVASSRSSAGPSTSKRSATALSTTVRSLAPTPTRATLDRPRGSRRTASSSRSRAPASCRCHGRDRLALSRTVSVTTPLSRDNARERPDAGRDGRSHQQHGRDAEAKTQTAHAPCQSDQAKPNRFRFRWSVVASMSEDSGRGFERRRLRDDSRDVFALQRGERNERADARRVVWMAVLARTTMPRQARDRRGRVRSRSSE